MSYRTTISAAYVALVWAVGNVADAAPVETNDAARAVRAWVARGGVLGAKLGAEVASVGVHAATNGLKFYSVQTVGGGTVFTSADDELEPILAFSSEKSATAANDPKSPLYALLNRDIVARVAAAAAVKRPAGLAAAQAQRPNAKWARLLAEAADREADAANGVKQPARDPIQLVGDLRVAPLVKTKWGQDTDGYGNPCYNCFTPGNSYCGCVATAMAQIMRLHQWPRTSRAAVTKDCAVQGEIRSATSYGGIYDWVNMPLEPNGADEAAMTDVQRQAIGKLCYDAGVSVRMDWTPGGGSSAFAALVGEALRDVFGYGSAYSSEAKMTDSDADGISKKVLSNLCAGYPVLLGIGYRYGYNASNGHAIVGDGYGYNDNSLYVHLNMGWYGEEDVWYQLPDMGFAGGYQFNSVDDIVYNIIPNGGDDKAVLAGRVTLPSGAPAAGASVSVYATGSQTPTTNLVANLYGVYGVVLPAGTTYEVRASAGAFAGSTTMSAALASPSLADESFSGYVGGLIVEFSTTKYVTKYAETGNAMDVDVALSGTSSGMPLAWSGVKEIEAIQFAEFEHAFAATGGDAPYAWRAEQTYVKEDGVASTYDATRGEAPYSNLDFDNEDRGVRVELGFDFPFGDQLVSAILLTQEGICFGADDEIGTSQYPDAQSIRVSRTATSFTVDFAGEAYTLDADGSITVAFRPDVTNAAPRVKVFGQQLEFPLESDGSPLNDITLERRGLPVGLVLDSMTGKLSGRPLLAGEQEFDVTVTDPFGESLTETVTLTVSEPTNRKPVIAAIDGRPDSGSMFLRSGSNQVFAVHVADPDGDNVCVRMYVNGDLYSRADNVPGTGGYHVPFAFTRELASDYNAQRRFTVKITVSDATWPEKVSSVWEVKLFRDWYVDAATEEDWDVQDGSPEHPWTQIAQATGYASAGDSVYVRPGTYRPFGGENREIRVIALGGPSVTFVDAEDNGPCYSCYGGVYDEELGMEIPGRKPWIEGFTLMNGFQSYGQAAGANGGTLVNCVIKDCSAARASECSSACIGGAFGSKLVNCVIADCSGEDAGAAFNCELYNCTVVNNGSSNGPAGIDGRSTAYNTVFWSNDGEIAAKGAVLEDCLTDADPLLADPANGDYRLRAGSPCIDAGSNGWLVEGVTNDLAGAERVQNGIVDIGAYEGVGVSGFVIQVNTVGYGTVTASALAVEAGGSITFTLSGRPLRRLVRNGTEDVTAQVTDGTYVWENITADGTLTAEFESKDLYVDATHGNDDWNGFTAETPKATLAAAVADVKPGETVYVKPGVYGPVALAEGQSARIVSTDGPEVTIIDGNGEHPCFGSTFRWDAELGDSVPLGELVGFTLRNGVEREDENIYVGGAAYARLENCTVTNCSGGAALSCWLFGCRILGNIIESEHNATGAGVSYGIVSNCVVRGNRLVSDYRAQGGGVYEATVYDSIICDNVVETRQYTSGNAQGGGTCYGYVYNSHVYNNLAVYPGDPDGCTDNIYSPYGASGNSEEPPSEGGLPELPENPAAEDVETALEGVTFADDGVKGMITGAVDPVATYNEFKAWAGTVPGGETSVLESPRAAVSFAFGAVDVFQNDPKPEIAAASVEPAEDGTGVEIAVTIRVRDGANVMAVASAKVAEMFEATRDLSDWNGEGKKLTPTVTDLTQGGGETVSFKVKPGDGTAASAFLRIRK